MSDAERLHRAVSELVRVYQFRDRDQICCYDISVTQCYALEALATGGPLRLGTLAERLRLDKSTMSRVVSTLTRKGYVTRTAEQGDGRALALAITREGRRLYAKIDKELIQQQEQMLAGMAPDVRRNVIEVISRLAQTAEARFVSGVSVGGRATGCAC